METFSDIRSGSARLVLRSTLTSPFGRKVRMAAEHLGLASGMELRLADTRDAADDLRQQNPLGKMPCLLIDGEAFYDSGVILELLDEIAGGGKLLPPTTEPLGRFRALTLARLADGIAEAALLIVYEGRFRRPEQVSDVWLDYQHGKVLRGLAAFEVAPPPPGQVTIVSIGLACALGYLDWRRPLDWRTAHPALAGWLADFAAAVPAFTATERTPS